MTIRPGEPWGRAVPRPDDLVVVADDPSLAAALTTRSTGRPIAVSGGDLSRTLGTAPLTGRTTLNELPIDLLEVRLDDSDEVIPACAHVIVRSPWTRGTWWRGPLLLVMNAEFRGNWDVAPRGHPNDGRVEVFEVHRTFSIRDRLEARRRVRSATHVPHPRIATRSVRAARWTFDAPMQTFVDGLDRGRATIVDVVVVADAAHILA